MRRYAQGTHVGVDRSKAEIEKTLSRYGADQFMYGWKEGEAIIAFKMSDRMIQFQLPLPDLNNEQFCQTPSGRERTNTQREKAWSEENRRRWRALSLVIKAKLEAVESGITTFEQEFLAHIVLPNGSTVGQWITPQIEEAYASKKMPDLLPSIAASRKPKK